MRIVFVETVVWTQVDRYVFDVTENEANEHALVPTWTKVDVASPLLNSRPKTAAVSPPVHGCWVCA